MLQHVLIMRYLDIQEVIEQILSRDKEIIVLYFGFYGNTPCPQSQIANKLGISQSYVSRRIRKALNNIKELLQSKEAIGKIDKKSNSKYLNYKRDYK